jgi:hypothetical protein
MGIGLVSGAKVVVTVLMINAIEKVESQIRDSGQAGF